MKVLQDRKITTIVIEKDDEVYKNIPSGDIIKTTLYERMTIENYDNKSDSDTKD